MEMGSKLIIRCPICDEKKKDRDSLVYYDKELSDKSTNKAVYFCTNPIHKENTPHWVISYTEVNDVIRSVRNYVMDGRIPHRIRKNRKIKKKDKTGISLE